MDEFVDVVSLIGTAGPALLQVSTFSSRMKGASCPDSASTCKNSSSPTVKQARAHGEGVEICLWQVWECILTLWSSGDSAACVIHMSYMQIQADAHCNVPDNNCRVFTPSLKVHSYKGCSSINNATIPTSKSHKKFFFVIDINRYGDELMYIACNKVADIYITNHRKSLNHWYIDFGMDAPNLYYIYKRNWEKYPRQIMNMKGTHYTNSRQC